MWNYMGLKCHHQKQDGLQIIPNNHTYAPAHQGDSCKCEARLVLSFGFIRGVYLSSDSEEAST